MKLKKILSWISSILFFLCLSVLVFNIIFDFGIHPAYFISFWVTYIISLFIFMIVACYKKHKILIGVLAIISIIGYPYLRPYQMFEFRKNITDSTYSLVVYPHSYKLMKSYYFLEKEVAKKESSIFFEPYSKIGIISLFACEVTLIEDHKDYVILDIFTKNGSTRDTLKIK